MPDQHNPITMKDIAREFGVSVATVSRALKGSPQISKERREQIVEFAKQHNFTPNIIAENLRKSKLQPVKIIGVILPEFTHFYFSSVLSGINEEAWRRGYQIIVAQSNEQYSVEADICEKFLFNKVCGVIVSQAKDTKQYDHFHRLLNSGIPIVFYDRICTGVNASRVVVDDYDGAFNAVNHLIATGCRRIAFYGSPQNLEISKNRLNGYRDALLHNGLHPNEAFIKQCDNRRDAEMLTQEVLEQEGAIPDAFFAVNDETAIGIMTAAKRLGYRIPQDISVCGFTNSTFSIACDPMLTTVEQRGEEVGRQAAAILINKVEGLSPKEKVERRVVRTRLIIRNSTR